jgi:3-oxoacyl-(acyl-carrier-protein) synthase
MKYEERRRVVITGLGPVTPIGIGRDSFWDGVTAGSSGITSLSTLNLFPSLENFRSQVVAATQAESLLGPIFHQNRFARIARLAFHLAMEDAGLRGDALRRSAVVMGNAVGGTMAMEQCFLGMDDGISLREELTPSNLMRQMSFHTITHEIAQLIQCDGPVLTMSTGCTAGIDAIGTGVEIIQSGIADLAVCGGAEAPITPIVFAAFDVIGALSQRNDHPTKASRPFDDGRDGFVLGEGAAVLIIEERRHALARGAHIYAEITGFASLSNGYHMTDLPADGTALARCMSACLDDAGIDASDVDHINAHGSSTKQNDTCETNAIKTALGLDQAYRITVNSLKSMTGHALGASNAIELCACALSLERQFVFATTNLEKVDPTCDLDYVPNSGRQADLNHLVKLSSGFSGIHSVMSLAVPN